jgi:hypothetical protein
LDETAFSQGLYDAPQSKEDSDKIKAPSSLLWDQTENVNTSNGLEPVWSSYFAANGKPPFYVFDATFLKSTFFNQSFWYPLPSWLTTAIFPPSIANTTNWSVEVDSKKTQLGVSRRKSLYTVRDVVTQFILGPRGSGAPFHYHCAALNFLLFGKKRWLLTPRAVYC